MIVFRETMWMNKCGFCHKAVDFFIGYPTDFSADVFLKEMKIP